MVTVVPGWLGRTKPAVLTLVCSRPGLPLITVNAFASVTVTPLGLVACTSYTPSARAVRSKVANTVVSFWNCTPEAVTLPPGPVNAKAV
jgi:hypothetical protein